MNDYDLIDMLWDVKLGKIHPNRCYKNILSLMGEKEIGVSSTSNTKDGVLHGVSEFSASVIGSTEEVQGNGSLEKITDTENILNCFLCGERLEQSSEGGWCSNGKCNAI